MHFLLGLFIVAAIVYFAFVRNENDTPEQAMTKIARVAVFFALVLGVLGILAINGVFD